MSKDWTPREAYFFDKQHYEQCGTHFHQMTWYVETDGKRVKEHPSKKMKQFASKYPYLTITAVSIVDELARIADKKLLSEMESYTKKLCESDDFKKKTHTGNLPNKVLNDWYNGKLDSWFYYREQNDQMLLDYLETVSFPEELLCETETNEMDL